MEETKEENEIKAKKLEVYCGLFIAIFAAVLAITDLGAGKYGDDEIITANQKANQYSWYQTKSIKQNLVEGQIDMIQNLITAGSINPNHLGALQNLVKNLEKDVNRYKKEKKEILLGSAKVGKENWAQEQDGEMGKIIGAKEYEEEGKRLGAAGDIFDMADFFLQLCLVFGAISVIMQAWRLRLVFLILMNLLGVIGSIISVMAYAKVL